MVDYGDYHEWSGEPTHVVDVEPDLRGCIDQLRYRFLTYSGPRVIWDVMVEGPRGTGKSYGVLMLIYGMCSMFPGIRVLLVRNKRRSMSGTTLRVFEDCMPIGEPAKEGPKPEGRSVYRFENGSEVHVAGLDESDRLRGFTVDVVYYEEGTEGDSPDGWDTLRGTLRSWRMPFQLMITTTNPKQPGHWLNRYAMDGRIERFKSKFEDNPILYSLKDGDFTPEGKAFIDSLKRLTGHRYRRDYLGEWCAAEGTVFDEYDETVHIIDATIERSHMGHSVVIPAWNRKVPIDWYGVGMDFGYRAPGVLQVWGVNDERRMLFRVAEVYQSGWQLDEWAKALRNLREEFPFETGVGDSAEPRTIDFINDRSRDFLRRGEGPFLRKAEKAKGKRWGLDQLRWGFSRSEGGPRTFLLRNALRYGRDENCQRANKPTCLEEELPNLVWRDATKSGGIERDEPDPSCADHAIDAAVYFHVFAWGRIEATRRRNTIFKPGTMGYVLGDYKVLGWDFDYDRN